MGAAVVVVLLTVAGLVALWPDGDDRGTRFAQGVRTAGTVTAVAATSCSSGAADPTLPEEVQGLQCLTATIRLDDGPDRGLLVDELTDVRTLPDLQPGQGVVLLRAGLEVPFDQRYQLIDAARGPPLLGLALVFVLAVVLVGRARGLLALAGLGSSLLVLGGFLVPALLDDRSPVLVAVVGGTAVMVCTLTLAHGLSLRAATALLGTVLGLGVTVGLSTTFVELASLTGLSSDEAAYVQVAFPGLDLRGLLLAGIVVGTLGVLDDVTVTQVSTVWELRRADPGCGRRALYRSAMRVGRDHIASTTNTLLLAYAGASLPVVVLFSTSGQSLASGLTANLVAEEVVRTLAGSVGLISAVPLTTALAAWCCPVPERDRLLEPLALPDPHAPPASPTPDGS